MRTNLTNISVNGITLSELDELYESLIEVNVPHTWDNWDEHWAELTEDNEEILSTYDGWTEYDEECPWA